MVAQLDSTFRKLSPRRSVARFLTATLFEGRPLTSKGRWANPLIKGFLILLGRCCGTYSKYNPVFIVGLGRSGTTILGKILSMHPKVGFLNEPKLIWALSNQSEDVVGNYRQCVGRFRLARFDASKNRVQRHRRYIGAYARLMRVDVVVDKYPECVYRMEYLKEIWPNARFVGIIRDGHSVLHSIADWNASHSKAHGGRTQDWWGKDDCKWRCLVEQVAVQHPHWQDSVNELLAIDDHRERAAVEWTLAAKELRDLKNTAGRQHSLRVIKYENLVRDKSSLVDEVLQFCQLQKDNDVKTYANTVLKQPRFPVRIKLSSLVQGPFDEMMEYWGYQ